MVFNRYLFKALGIATAFIAVTLAMIIFLTQSLKFLELVINSGASGGAFLMLTLLSMPRFFEIILPIAVTASVLFIYNRMTIDSELVVMRAVGSSPALLARPALAMSGVVMVILFIITSWLGPVALSHMQSMRDIIKAQYSSMMFHEGVFNPIGNGLTVFVRGRNDKGELVGLMIYDKRAKTPAPVTIVAKRGVLVTNNSGQQVVVFDGTRQAYDLKTGNLTRLDFSRYIIDMPEDNGRATGRWREPEERTLWELFHPDLTNADDRKAKHEFKVQAHRRIISPLMAPAFAVVALATMLLGPVDRRGMGRRVTGATALVILIECLYLTSFNVSKHGWGGVVMMYILIIAPLLTGLYMLSPISERMRARIAVRLRRWGVLS